VVLSDERFRAFRRGRWPQNVFTILSEPPVFPGAPPIPDDAHLANIDLTSTPLVQTLERVEAECVQRGITSVAFEGVPGFEDEAAALGEWRLRRGQIKKLILHVACVGHLIDYGSVADEVE
jgi:hypothetical protein